MKRITKIEVLGYAVTVTDTETNEGQRLELRGDGPWNLDEAAIAVDTRKVHRQVAPPRSDAITLRLVRGRDKVQIAAIGRGAKAWTSAQGTLLESRWELDPSGAPVAHFTDRATLVDEIRAALPSVALDLSHYHADDGPSATSAKRSRAKREEPTPAGGKAGGAKPDTAIDQLNLLQSDTRNSNSPSSDFNTYRYLATEGFLPGYNFPRLPLMAYIPATNDGRGRQTYLQRPRFLALSEFGPRSLVYHEGRAYRVVRAMLSLNQQTNSLIRAAFLGALDVAGDKGLRSDQLGAAQQRALGFDRPVPELRSEWLLEPSLKGFNLQEAESALRQVLSYRGGSTSVAVGATRTRTSSSSGSLRDVVLQPAGPRAARSSRRGRTRASAPPRARNTQGTRSAGGPASDRASSHLGQRRSRSRVVHLRSWARASFTRFGAPRD